MRPPDAMTIADRKNIHVPVAEINATAARAPDLEALRHKRRGRWRFWSWADVVTETEGLANALQQRGVNDRSAVAISGDYTPALVLFAIAAAQAGAAVVPGP